MKSDKTFSLLLGNIKFLIAAIVLFVAIASININIVAQSLNYEAVEANPAQIEEKGKVIKGKISIFENTSDIATSNAYVFSTTTGGSLTDMTGSTQLIGATSDDTASAVNNLPFEFYFMGVRYTQFSASSNGFIRLGGTAVSTTQYTLGAASTPLISAFGSDLEVSPSGRVHFVVTGTAPNRVLTVEFLNMTIIYDGTSTGVDGTYQVRLYENTGAIQFVYGSMNRNASLGFNSANNQQFIGFSSNTGDNNFATIDSNNVVATTGTITGNLFPLSTPIASLNSAANGLRRTYTFTPPIPNAPSNLTFTGVSPTSITLNWADNSTNEDLFAVYRSTDGVNYSFLTTALENATSFTDTSGIPGTNYFYRVFAVSEGALSTALSGSQSTLPPGNDTCNGAGGNWSSTTTWTDGTVPTNGDNVTIGSGCTVTLDIPNAVAFNVTINNGGTLQSPLTGAVTTNNLTVGGNVTNNGTLDLSTNGNTSGATLTFGSFAVNATFSGSGAVTDVRSIVVVKGSQAVTVEMSPDNFTVQDVNIDAAGFLTLTSGIFKISGAFTATNRIFTLPSYTIPATGGIWLNNPNFTVAGQIGSATNNGLFRVSGGTYNIGVVAGNSLGGGAGAVYTIEGGTVNIAGRLQTTSIVTYNQSGGTLNVSTVGNTATTATFGLTATTNTFNMTGGSIVIVLPSTSATPLDYSVATNANFITSPALTTLQIGNGSTPANSTFRVLGGTPSILVSSGQNMAIGSGTAGGAIFLKGSTLTNNGAIVNQGTGASGRFDFQANGAMVYTGTGTFGTAAAPIIGAGISSNSGNGGLTTLNAPIVTNRVNIFGGGFVNSNQITLGNGGTSQTVIQIGNTTTPVPSGTFDVSPVYNTGSGGHLVTVLRTTTLNRPSGFEINPTRSLINFTFDNDAVGATYDVTGGNLTVAGVLTLTNGVITTGSNTITHNGAVTRTNGYVNGGLSRDYTAIGAYTYPVGQNGYSPFTANVTAGTFPSALKVSVTDGTFSGMDPDESASRYWDVTEIGDLTVDISFTYLDPDVNGNELLYRVLRREGGITTNPGGSVDAATNTASITGVTNFSEWAAGNIIRTASAATLSGRVITAEGNGIKNAAVILTGGTLTQPMIVKTGSFGRFSFENLQTGQSYIVTVDSKRYIFDTTTRVVNLDSSITDIDFVSTPSR